MIGTQRKILPAIAGIAACALVLFSGPALAQAPAEQAAASGGYYIEFRVAQIGAYGHSYVAYGRLNGAGKPASAQYADLHPRGNYAVMALGHVLPVPANTVWDPDVLKLPVASSYRRKLSAADYQKLLAAVKRANANKNPYWNAISNNCNHYVAELARAIGLRAPNDFQVSYSFVPALRELNEGQQAARPEARPDAARKKPAAAGTSAPVSTAQSPRS
jgi:hypothetical protein